MNSEATARPARTEPTAHQERLDRQVTATPLAQDFTHELHPQHTDQVE
jgi:hypothetical protein